MNTARMRASQQLLSSRTSRRLSVAALLLIATGIVFGYGRLIQTPEREHVVRRYNEFRGAVASGETERIMRFVAPEVRPWAESGLHVYQNFALPLDHRSTVSVSFGDATICPKPLPGFLIFRGGHVIKMVRHKGEWLLGRVYID